MAGGVVPAVKGRGRQADDQRLQAVIAFELGDGAFHDMALEGAGRFEVFDHDSVSQEQGQERLVVHFGPPAPGMEPVRDVQQRVLIQAGGRAQLPVELGQGHAVAGAETVQGLAVVPLGTVHETKARPGVAALASLSFGHARFHQLTFLAVGKTELVLVVGEPDRREIRPARHVQEGHVFHSGWRYVPGNGQKGPVKGKGEIVQKAVHALQ